MKLVAMFGLTVLLAACGGGGGDSAPAVATPVAPIPVASAEGFWEGTASTGNVVSLAVLETGETWGVYSSSGAIVGALFGNTTSLNGSSLSGSGTDFNIPSRTVGAGTYSGTFSANSTIRVATSSGSTFSGTYVPAYDQPASIAALAGSFSGQGVSGSSPVQNASIIVSASSNITVPATLGCSASGTVAPRPGGKNIYNLTVTFAGSTCALGNGA